MREKTTTPPKDLPQEAILQFACNIKMAGWLMSQENVESLDEIKLHISEKGKTFVTCFFNCRSRIEQDFNQVIEYQFEHPEEFQSEVKKGLDKLNTYLNRLIEADQKCSALNKTKEAAE